MSWRDRNYNRDTADHDFYTRVTGRSVTVTLVIICSIVFVIDLLTSRIAGRPPFAGGLLTDWGSFSATGVAHFQAWRFFTFQFLHDGLFHIIFNMWALYFFGRFVESYLGSRVYLAFYLLCGVAGALLYLALWGIGEVTKMPNIPFVLIHDASTPLVGASAGIFGVLMGAAFVAPEQQISLMFPPITLKIRTIAYITVGIAVIMLLARPDAGGDAAHLGGAVAGFLLIRRSRWLRVFERFSLPKRDRASKWQRQQEKEQRQRDTEQAEVDAILDKVRQHGIQSLSKREKKVLQRETDRQRRTG